MAVIGTKIFVSVMIVLLVAFDIYLAADKVPGNTYSAIIHKWALATPIVSYAWGVLAGHFFWSRTVSIIPNVGGYVLLGWSGVIIILLGMALRYFGLSTYPLAFMFLGILMGHLFFPLEG